MNKSQIYQAIITSLNIRLSFVDSTQICNDIIQQKKADPLLSHFIIHSCQSALSIIPTIPQNHTINIRWKYEGILKNTSIEINSKSQIRCYFSEKSLTDKTLDINKIFTDKGQILVTKYKNGQKISDGITDAPLLEYGNDLAFYFSTSEQQETEIINSYLIQADTKQPVKIARCIMLQALPDCQYNKLEKVIQTLRSPQIKDILQKTQMSIQECITKIQDILTLKIKILACQEPTLFCTCNQEKISQVINNFSEQEKNNILQTNGKITLTCDFCDTKYFY